nr:hypothetical protein [Frankia gtarii]
MDEGPVGTVVETIEALAGYTIGITAARRRKELGAALERRGAKVVYAPALQIVPTTANCGGPPNAA